MTTVSVDSERLQAEYKEGYRDGLTVAVTIAQQCVDDPTSHDPADVLVLLKALAESHVLDPTPREDPEDGH